MKIDKVESINVNIPLEKSFGGGTYNVEKRSAIITKIFTDDGLISEVFAGDDRFRGDQIAKCINKIVNLWEKVSWDVNLSYKLLFLEIFTKLL